MIAVIHYWGDGCVSNIILFIGLFLIGFIGLLFAGLWVVIRWYHLQRSLQWWYRQHVLRLFDEAEAVRNGILQDAFTLRRTLELAPAPPRRVSSEVSPSEPSPSEPPAVLLPGADKETLLTTLGELHDSLKRFSDFLSPPYLEDSFPLAIDHLFKSHHQQHPGIVLELSIPDHWQPDSYEQSRIVWMAIDEFLRLTLTRLDSVRSISACLTQHAHTRELVVRIVASSLNRQNIADALKELAYLSRSAQFLTAGTCTYRQDDEALIWSMCWS
jgi:hypothetical protein